MTDSNQITPLSTPNRTPQATRTYLNVGQLYHHTPLNHSHSQSPHMIHQINSVTSQNKGVIYGTTIDTGDVLNNLQKFINEFEITKQVDGEVIAQKNYLAELKSLLQDEQTCILNVQGTHLKEFDREIYYQFIYFPAEMISCFDLTIKNMYERMFMQHQTNPIQLQKKRQKKDKLMVGITTLSQNSIIRNLTQKQINRLISFKGIVIRCSDIYPQMKTAFFRCANCSTQVQVILQNAKVEQPKQCKKCKLKSTMEIIHNLCIFTDKQYIKFQELPELVPQGETPHSLTIIAYDFNVDLIKPGDRVEIVGIYRAQPVRVQRGKRTVRSVFNTYVDLISSKVLQDNRFRATLGQKKTQFDDEQRKQFYNMASDPKILQNLVQSFAPSIFGNEDIKKGILTQLFGGSKKVFSQSGRGRFRSDINVCLVGDPSTAKSQLLQQVHKITPRGIYTSGKGSSAVGLTANVRKDPQTREYVLQSGALVLSDLGICCIDQFDKMDDNSKTILLQAMEQQTISVAKAGIVCSLNSRTSILAAANPVNSRYNPKKSVVQNINLPPSLLSRFDLIYILLDRAIESYDTRLAHHILDIYSNKKTTQINQGIYSKNLLTNYITYARQYITPQLTDQSGKKLVQAYVDMRKIGNNKKIITATPRQLQSLIRLSQSLAKMRLSQIVELKDVDEAIRLMKVATQQAATDPTTGIIDMDVIVTGRTASSRSKISKICGIIKQHIQNNLSKYRKGVNFQYIFNEVNTLFEGQNKQKNFVEGQQQRVSESQLLQSFKVLTSEDFIMTYGPNKNRPAVRLQKDLYSDK